MGASWRLVKDIGLYGLDPFVAILLLPFAATTRGETDDKIVQYLMGSGHALGKGGKAIFERRMSVLINMLNCDETHLSYERFWLPRYYVRRNRIQNAQERRHDGHFGTGYTPQPCSHLACEYWYLRTQATAVHKTVTSMLPFSEQPFRSEDMSGLPSDG